MGIVGRKGRCSCCSTTFDHHIRLLLTFFIAGVLLQRDVVESSTLHYTRHDVLRVAMIREHLDNINKLPVLTIESPDGDLIDCVDKTKQLALDHPLLKDHKIQKAPTEMPRAKRDDGNGSSGDLLEGTQMWHQNGTRCPKGTIPVRRSSVDDVLRVESLVDFGRKQPPPNQGFTLSSLDVDKGNGHEYAIAYTGSAPINGAKATINVWAPQTEVPHEFSLAQIWISAGSFDSDYNTVEAGWQVNPQLFRDGRPRLFIYWTRDAYHRTGCYNLLCSGFIQTNSRIVIGGAISPISVYGGKQYDITILIWKDPKTGNWWLSYGNNIAVGYWPAEIFTYLASHATRVEWGGEVVNSRANGHHTATDMCSGRFAEGGFGKACYFKHLEIVHLDNGISPAQGISTFATNPSCYNIRTYYSNEWGTHFYYGGPGYGPQCP